MSEEQCRPQSQTARKPALRSVPIRLGVAGELHFVLKTSIRILEPSKECSNNHQQV
jgi:hypothetical protein